MMNLIDYWKTKNIKINENRLRLNIMAEHGITSYVQKATDQQLNQDELSEKVINIIQYFDAGLLQRIEQSKKDYNSNLLNYQLLKSYLYNNDNWKNYTNNLKPFEFENLVNSIFEFILIKLKPTININELPKLN